MQLPQSFSDFLSDIRPTDDQLKNYQDGHRLLRVRMHQDNDINGLRVADFLQGSYRRATAIRPQNGQKSDVDVVVVTNCIESPDVDAIARRFEEFLDRHEDYQNRYERKTHSIGISLEEVELDLVITSAPSEAAQEALQQESDRTQEILSRRFSPLDYLSPWKVGPMGFRETEANEWRSEPLRVPNYDDDVPDEDRWSSTDPLTQISWTSAKNAECHDHYVNVVKALKWWRRTKCQTPKHPKGYPVEHMIGSYCPDQINSIAEGVTLTLERIRDCPVLNYHLRIETSPTLPDRGIPEHNVWKRIEPEDFSAFMRQVGAAAEIAREALDLEDVRASSKRWHDLFDDPFPYDEDDNKGRVGFTAAKGPADPSQKRYG